MPIHKFGRTNVGISQRVVSGGVTSTQVNNTFLRRDGENTATANIDMTSHKLINVLDPVDDQDIATKHYVDNKLNLNTLTENLILSVGADTLRSLGCMDLSENKGFSIFLGSIMNQIQCELNQPITLQASDGIVCRQGATNIIRFGKAAGDLRTDVYQDILMNQRYIADLADPNTAQDAATKNYVDNSTKRNYSGYIPVLEANASRLGFVARASTTINSNYNPYGAFNNFNADGLNGSWVSATSTGWLQIQCPQPVVIWQVALKSRAGLPGRNITAWNIAGSNNGTMFTTLLTSTTALLGAATAPSFVNISTTTAYQYYRLNITGYVGSVDVGVQVMQLYVLSN